MAKHLCTSCERKLPGPVAFCPSCDQPTVHATDAERLEWDLRRWRAHVDRSVASGSHVSTAASTAVALVESPAPAERAAEEDPIRVETRSVIVEPAPVAPVAEPEPDGEFAYRECVSCGKTDWLVRSTHNDDDTWNYWCVRCSRSFKTEVRIPYALKPFLSAGAVLGGIIAATLLMLR